MPEPAVSFQTSRGMRFIVAENHAVPAAAVSIWARAGVCDEPADRRGIAHFVEHMMFRGSKNFGPEEHAKRLARLGGNCNAFTSFDETVYHEVVPVGALEEVFRLEADRFRFPTFSPEHVVTERKVILEELRVYENQPMVRAMRRINNEISAGHPYALDPLGRREDLNALSAADLVAFHRRLYRPENAFGVVVGDVTPEQVRELAEKWFAGGDKDEPADAAPSETPAAAAAAAAPPPYRIRTGKMRLKLSFEVPATARLHQLGPSAEEDAPALDLLTALLADGDASPVREMLVKKKRLCVEAGAIPVRLRHGGMLAFFGVFLPPGNHAARRDVLRKLCNELAERGPDPDRFAQHLKRFRKNRAADAWSLRKHMLGLGSAELLLGGYEKYDHQPEELSAVGPERVRDAARRLFAPENTLELEVVPERTKWWMPLVGLAAKVVRG